MEGRRVEEEVKDDSTSNMQVIHETEGYSPPPRDVAADLPWITAGNWMRSEKEIIVGRLSVYSRINIY